MSANEVERGYGVSQLLILVLSIYVVVALAIEHAFALPREVSKVMQHLDTIICLIFLWDFFTRLYHAPQRLAFLKWGWIDFVSSIPMRGVFRVGRLVRVVRVLRVLRAVRSLKVFLSVVFRHRAKSAFAAVVATAVLMVIFSSIAILCVETSPDANIRTESDALWWSFLTITTLGNGGNFPMSPEGRLIAAVLLVVGAGLFGTFTGCVSSWFVESEIEEQGAEDDRHMSELAARLERIEAMLAQLVGDKERAIRIAPPPSA